MPILPSALVAALQAEGLLPPNCGDVSVHFPVDGLVYVQYKQYIEFENFPALIRALSAAAEAAGVDP